MKTRPSPTLDLLSLKQRLEQALSDQLPNSQHLLHQAMRYSVLNPGKRIRPLLVYTTGLDFGANAEQLDAAAIAVELIHVYSLIHDDLQDRDLLRRGLPTIWNRFGDHTAINLGDYFIAGSYEIPVNKSLIDLAYSGDIESLNLMMKWGYGKSKQFIGGNPLQKILNSSREIREVLAVDLIACNNYKNGAKAAKKINCPTFFILGEVDKMIKIEKGKEFAGLIPNSKIHIIKNCGHMIILENAFEMREKINEFLKK